MERHNIARIYWGLIFGLVILTGLQFFTAFQPYTFVASNVQNLLGVNINYNIPTIVRPFYYSSLDVVNAPAITCTLSTALYGLTDTGQTVPLSVESSQASPYRTSFDLIGGIGQTFQTFSVREQLDCPVTVSSYPPNLVSGTTTLIWTATKADGTTVTIMNDQEQIDPTLPDLTHLALPSGTVPLTGITLYTWVVSKSQIENALGVNPLVPTDFNSLQSISVSNTDTFYQGDVVSVPWTFTNAGPSMISYTLHEVTNPTSINLKPLNFNKMTIQVTAPASKKVNMQSSQAVTIVGSIENWQASMGYPELKVSNVDTTGNGNNVIADFFLQPDIPSASTSAQTFTFKYAFPLATSSGQYTFSLLLAGNPSVPTDSVYVSNTPISCPSGQYFDGVTNVCKNIATTDCGNGVIVTSGQQCPAPTNTPKPPSPPSNTCPTNISACLATLNFSSLLQSGQQAIGLGIFLAGLLVFIMIISAIWHSYHRKEGNEEMMIPTPMEMVSE